MGKIFLSYAKYFHFSCHATWLPCKTFIPLGKRADPSLDVNLDELPVDRALGVRWHIESGTFGFKVLEFEKDI